MGCFASQPTGAVPASGIEPRLVEYAHLRKMLPQSESLPQSTDVFGRGNHSNVTSTPGALGESDD